MLALTAASAMPDSGCPSKLARALTAVRERYAFPWSRLGRKHSVIQLNGAGI